MTEDEINALLFKAQQGDEVAQNDLITSYKWLIDTIIKRKRYFLPDGTREDLFIEGQLGVFAALRDYNVEKSNGMSFTNFCSMTVTRMLQSRIIKGNRQKEKILNESISFEAPIKAGDEHATIFDLMENDDNAYKISSKELMKPEDYLLEQDAINQFMLYKDEAFSDVEKEVFELFWLNDLSYKEIQERTGYSEKKIDNSLMRCKRKLVTFNQNYQEGKSMKKWKTTNQKERMMIVDGRKEKKKKVMKEHTYRLLESAALSTPEEKEERVNLLVQMYPDIAIASCASNLKAMGLVESYPSYKQLTLTEKGLERLQRMKTVFSEFKTPEVLPEPKEKLKTGAKMQDESIRILELCSLSQDDEERIKILELCEEHPSVRNKFGYLRNKGYIEYAQGSPLNRAVITEKGMEELQGSMSTIVSNVNRRLGGEEKEVVQPETPKNNYSNDEVLEIVKNALLKNEQQEETKNLLEEKEKEIQSLLEQLNEKNTYIETLEKEKERYKEKVLSLFELN